MKQMKSKKKFRGRVDFSYEWLSSLLGFPEHLTITDFDVDRDRQIISTYVTSTMRSFYTKEVDEHASTPKFDMTLDNAVVQMRKIVTAYDEYVASNPEVEEVKKRCEEAAVIEELRWKESLNNEE
jgi:hypothetical protein